MDPPVGGDDLGQPLHIGGVEFGQLPVLQDQVDDGVLGAELFQHLGAGGVPRLGLFHRGQPQPLKEDPPQLLGRIDVKLLPRLGIDLPLEHLDAGLQGLAEVGQGRLVHQHPGLLHLRQHGAEGALNLLIHLGQAELCHLLGQAAVQGGQQADVVGQGLPGLLGALLALPGFGAQVVLGRGQGHPKVLGPHLVQVIAAVGGREEVGGNGPVKDKALRREPPVQGPAHHVLAVVPQLGDARAQQARQEGLVPRQGGLLEEGHLVPLLPPAHCQGGEVGQGQHPHRLPLPLVQQGLGLGVLSHPHHLLGGGAGEVGRAGSLDVQPHLGDEFLEVQFLEQLQQQGGVGRFPQRLLRGEVQGGIPPDGAQVVGEEGALPPFRQPLLHHRPGLQGLLVQAGVDLRQGAVVPEEGQGGLFPHPGHPGDVVGGIPHEGLQVHHLGRGKAVLLPEGSRVHLLGGGLPHPGGDQLHIGLVADQLEGVPVPGGHPTVPAGLLALAGDGADEVVGLPPGQLIAGDVQGVQHLFEHRHLHRQVLGHALPLGLVALVGQVAEGGLPPVEGDADPVRLQLPLHPPQNIQKPKNGMGGEALLVIQGVHPEKGPVHNGVSVDHQQLHSITSFAAGPLPRPVRIAQRIRRYCTNFFSEKQRKPTPGRARPRNKTAREAAPGCLPKVFANTCHPPIFLL